MMRKIMCRKIVLAAFLISGALFGMDGKNKTTQLVWDNTFTYYAEVGLSQLYKGAHISKHVYPVCVKRRDNQMIGWFNFDDQIKLMQFRNNVLSVTLNNDKSYQFYCA